MEDRRVKTRTMEPKIDNYKSPIAALCWSLALPGFGQFYLREVFLGIILMLLELGVNINSNLNLAVYYAFHGDVQQSHTIINYEWGLFYPSIWAFSMWHAYNRAKTINSSANNVAKRTYLTGFFIGLVIGMNLGLYWHDNPLFMRNNVSHSPIFNGLILGIAGASIGHLIDIIFSVFKKEKP